MPSKNHLVYRKNVVQCAACGCSCTWVKSHQGKSQLTPVWFDSRCNDWFYTTYGNHANFRQIHDCVADAEKVLADLQNDLDRLGADIDLDTKEERDAHVAGIQARMRSGELAQGLGVAMVNSYVERQLKYQDRKADRKQLLARMEIQQGVIDDRKAKIAAARKSSQTS